ncbi:uncharacterized protein LOC132717720 [Ruditapes philippinarum]|uniref:uncharacterized protein LOC132717720 n=1 Tax=Ruditapes philippinarum TaxID=129788 RepID=UPI00295B774D|nr:uncharacterized protein LOC132717720 [Ruditapes philippinarum]
MVKIHTYDEEKVHFQNYDDYVSKIQPCHMTSMASLIKYFEEPVIKDENRELFLARAFFVWIANVKANDEVEDLPEEISSIFSHGVIEAFALLCESGNIQYQLVEGITKNMHYLPGHTEDDTGILRTRWTIFRSNERWHIVDICRGIFTTKGYSRGGEILLENKGETVFEEREGSEGVCEIHVNDLWFCLDPSIFIIYSLPDDPEWQLLPPEKHISKEEFLALPHFTQTYFIANLQLLSEYTGLLHSKNGKCTISFGANKADSRNISMLYHLSLKKDTVNLEEINADDLPLLVVYAPGIDTFSFNIRFPVAAEYIFETFVSSPDAEELYFLFATFKIICLEPDPNCKKIPFDAGCTGYGFGYTAVEYGLKNPSTYLPNVPVACTQSDFDTPELLTFQIDTDKVEEIEFLSKIVGGENDENAVTKTRVDEVHGKLYVSAGIQKEGEYALSILAKDKQTGGNAKEIINYLLSTNLTEEEKEIGLKIKKRKKELSLQLKLQECHQKKNALAARIKDIEAEIETLKKLSDKNSTKEHDNNAFESTDEQTCIKSSVSDDENNGNILDTVEQTNEKTNSSISWAAVKDNLAQATDNENMVKRTDGNTNIISSVPETFEEVVDDENFDDVQDTTVEQTNENTSIKSSVSEETVNDNIEITDAAADEKSMEELNKKERTIGNINIKSSNTFEEDDENNDNLADTTAEQANENTNINSFVPGATMKHIIAISADDENSMEELSDNTAERTDGNTNIKTYETFEEDDENSDNLPDTTVEQTNENTNSSVPEEAMKDNIAISAADENTSEEVSDSMVERTAGNININSSETIENGTRSYITISTLPNTIMILRILILPTLQLHMF